MAGAGDAGIEQLPGQDGAGPVRQDQGGMGEDGEGEDGLHRLETAGQDPLDALLAIPGGEGDAGRSGSPAAAGRAINGG